MEDYITTLKTWNCEISRNGSAHYAVAANFNRLHFTLGVLIIIFSTLLGTDLFTVGKKDVETNPPPPSSISGTKPETPGLIANMELGIFAPIIGAAAAVLAGLQTFLNYSRSADVHLNSGREWEKINWRVDSLLAEKSSVNGATLKEIEDRVAAVRDKSPSIPKRHWKKAVGKHPKPDET